MQRRNDSNRGKTEGYPILGYPRRHEMCIGIAAGGVLMQDQGNGFQPLVFLSRRPKPTEQRYSMYERILAVFAYCLQSW